ncbi:hypothetical protein NA2_14012 [Nitratireductor pacificus pht-3B]|uniref:GNAT family N-acetyltransferase n=1 Tax=Nitratireductor pacificus pht-3B TaxID=391937 RepID=K2MM18_9HYPH|nr:hypothetical protein NA2_14012 [Nitratireductor pacificus pht-3B]
MAREDVPVIASMFQRILRRDRRAASPDLIAYLSKLFLDPPNRDPDIASLVHLRADGSVSGFMGVLPMRMAFEGRPLRAAIGGSFMVEDHEDDPYAGARLLRAFQNGPQDLSLTETANDVSTTMWRKLRGTILPDYSLEWLRVIRPTAFVSEMAAGVFGPLRLISPLARPIDALLGRIAPGAGWAHLPAAALGGKALPSSDADAETAAALFRRFVELHALHPDWPEADLQRMVAESGRKANYGGMVRRQVLARNGTPVGLFLYYGDRARIGRVIQVLALPGQEGAVIDSMLADACERGLVALRGRSQPALLDAMLGRRFAFVHASSSIVHARDQSLIAPFRAGQAFFNGFAGESWSRLLGDRFD